MTLNLLTVALVAAAWPLLGGVVLGVMARVGLGGTPAPGDHTLAGLVSAMWLWPLILAGVLGIAVFTMVAGPEVPSQPEAVRLRTRTRK